MDQSNNFKLQSRIENSTFLIVYIFFPIRFAFSVSIINLTLFKYSAMKTNYSYFVSENAGFCDPGHGRSAAPRHGDAPEGLHLQQGGLAPHAGRLAPLRRRRAPQRGRLRGDQGALFRKGRRFFFAFLYFLFET